MRKRINNKTIINKLNIILSVLIVSVALIGTGCSKETNENETDGTRFYYVNESQTGIESEEITFDSNNRETNIENTIKRLKEEKNGKNKQTVIPEYVSTPTYKLVGEEGVLLDFDNSYYELTGVNEALTRAAIVLSLCEVPGINSVDVTVAGESLTINDKTIETMTATDFVDSVNNTINSIQELSFVLYYSSEDGKSIVKTTVNTKCNLNQSLEEGIVETLINCEPKSDKKSIKTINENTKINKITTKGGICYIDLSKDFLDKPDRINDEVYIYSVVNSLTELPSISKVSFTINGEEIEKFREKIEFNKLFERNLDLVVEVQ